jgi:hypothetical protein
MPLARHYKTAINRYAADVYETSVKSKRVSRRDRTELRLGFESPQEGDKATHESTQTPKPLRDFYSTDTSQKASAGSATQPRRTTRCAEVMTGEIQEISEYLHIYSWREERNGQAVASTTPKPIQQCTMAIELDGKVAADKTALHKDL